MGLSWAWSSLGLSPVEAWFSTALDIEEVLSGVGGDQLHVMVADVTRLTGPILDCTLLTLVNRGVGMGYSSGLSSECGFSLLLQCALVPGSGDYA